MATPLKKMFSNLAPIYFAFALSACSGSSQNSGPSSGGSSGNGPSSGGSLGNEPSNGGSSSNGSSSRRVVRLGDPVMNGDWHLSSLICHDGSTFDYAPYNVESNHTLRINGSTGELIVQREARHGEGSPALREVGGYIRTTITWPFRITEGFYDPRYLFGFHIDGSRRFLFHNSSSVEELFEIPMTDRNDDDRLVYGEYLINSNSSQFDIFLSASRFMFTGISSEFIDLIDIIFSSACGGHSNAHGAHTNGFGSPTCTYRQGLNAFLRNCRGSDPSLQRFLTIRFLH